jgi:hypothetical protein
MWRELGQLVSYVYYPGKEAACGVDWTWEGAFAGSKYRTIRFYVKVNTPGMVPPVGFSSTHPTCIMHVLLLSGCALCCPDYRGV